MAAAAKLLGLVMKVEDDDDEFERLLGEFENREFDAVDIGVLSDEEWRLRVIAGANECGTRDGHIPERSFIRAGVDLNAGAINRRADEVWGQILDGAVTMNQGLGLMGEFIQRLITQRITNLKTPPNAASTIARKGSDNPLIDTGRMRQSIRWELANSSDGESGI